MHQERTGKVFCRPYSSTRQREWRTMLISKIMRSLLTGGDHVEKPGSPVLPASGHAPATITDEYRQMQTQLHQDPEYGMASVH
jgi:hypothetical protein